MKLTDDKQNPQKIDATTVFHNIRTTWNDDELPSDLNLEDAADVTAIDDKDSTLIADKR